MVLSEIEIILLRSTIQLALIKKEYGESNEKIEKDIIDSLTKERGAK